jgi:hypothetical protein
MIRYTVVWVASALDELADIWMAANDRSAVSAASDEIDRELAEDAHSKGIEVHEGLRSLLAPPLQVHFVARIDDRVVEVLQVQRK